MAEENIRENREEISVDREHIFPIIKKWLYSDKEIFLREIVSNACDAITKLRRLRSLGEAADDENDAPYRITVSFNKAMRTLTVRDNGVGMTEEELRRYICQIALSGALEFVEKYEAAEGAGIIGHFGLGFYSAFMVSDTVDILTKHHSGADGVKWVCAEDGTYEITAPYEVDGVGTSVVMHISEDETEFLEESRLRAVLDKYCAFMPVDIYLIDEEKETDETPAPINDTTPLWTKPAQDCTDEDYKSFYKKVFGDYRDPLFWIHVNADYPLNFKGVLFFPQLSSEFEPLEGQVRLYYNQVFVSDHIKEIVPEYLLAMRCVLDCPELPLNVSRSYLQNNSYVAKVSAHIVKKFGDKINALYNNDREAFEKMWDSIRIFVEYAAVRDRKLYNRIKDAVLFKQTDGTHVTLTEYLEAAKETNEGTVYYAADANAQSKYISMFTSEGIRVVMLDKVIDTQYAQMVEHEAENVKFLRVDAAIADAMKGDGESEELAGLTDLFRRVSGKETLTVTYSALKDEKTAAVLNISEESRRMEEMMRMYAMGKDVPAFPTEEALVVNTASPVIRKLESAADDRRELIARYIWGLALLANRPLTAEESAAFFGDSFDLLNLL